MPAICHANDLITTPKLVGRLRITENRTHSFEIICHEYPVKGGWLDVTGAYRSFPRSQAKLEKLDLWQHEDLRQELIDLFKAAKRYARNNLGSVRYDSVVQNIHFLESIYRAAEENVLKKIAAELGIRKEVS